MRTSVKTTPLSKVRVVQKAEGATLYIGTKHISALATRHIELIECFLNQSGRIIPYERLAATMKWRSTGKRFRHCLQQCIRQLKMILRKERVRAHFAVADDIGYALCEVARV
jgi:DNA-binding winged helix-turn-helix (wHTH) protein